MAVLSVNPTRMVLNNLKKKLSVATRGHRLLKDKRDELMRQFLELVRENKTLRERVENKITKANSFFIEAVSQMSREKVECALMLPKERCEIDVGIKNIMSVNLPEFRLKHPISEDIFCYGFGETDENLDFGIEALAEILPDLIHLAEIENKVMRLSEEIEKTRRRVNALEHVLIPDTQDTIRYIMMKLDENERSATTRLMKIKDSMIKEKWTYAK